MNGVAEIEKGLTTIFETRGRKVTLETLAVTVRSIRPDVALAHVTNQLSGLLSPDGQTLLSHQELSIRVLLKDQGAGIWSIAFLRLTQGSGRFARRCHARRAADQQWTAVQTPEMQRPAPTAGMGNRSPT
jgi:hypothetical protein